MIWLSTRPVVAVTSTWAEFSMLCCSVAQLCPTLCNPVDCSMPRSPVLHHPRSLLRCVSVESVILSNHLILCCPFSSCSQSFPASGSLPVSQLFIGGQSHISTFSFSISHSNEYSGLTSLRIDWFDLLVVQRTLNSLLQHHNLKASILWHSTSFMVQFSHP